MASNVPEGLCLQQAQSPSDSKEIKPVLKEINPE